MQILFRRCIRDVVIRNVAIPAGSTLALGYAAANHDAAAFENADDFVIRRGSEVRRHFGFGWGIHMCVGAPLARMEAVTAINVVLDRISDLAFAEGFAYERVSFFVMRGPRHLDVVFDPV